MTGLLTRKLILPGLAVLASAVVLSAIGIAVYAAHGRSLATALVDSARDIRTTEDANREIAAWRKRAGGQFWEESDRLGGDHNYDGQINNLSIARLRVVKPMAVTLGVTMHDGKLRCVTLLATAGPSTGLWIQEWFDSDTSGHVHVGKKDRPWGAVVEFSASVPEAQRRKVFAVNTKCFVQFGGCKSAEDVLPAVWQLDDTNK